MTDSGFDRLPSREREKIRKRMRTPEAYEALRQAVRDKGPEALEKELARADALAEAHFLLESEPRMRLKLKAEVERSLRHGEHVLERTVDAKTERGLLEGKFSVEIGPHPKEHHDTVLVVPEGNVQEKLPVSLKVGDQFVASLLQHR